MLIGQFSHNLDAKNRIIVPIKFREDLGEKIVLTKGLSTCLAIYPLSEWERIVEKVKSMPMAQVEVIEQYLFHTAYELEYDVQGRILIPNALKSFAQLQKEAVIVGVSSRVEIWDAAMWNEAQSRISSEDAKAAMRALAF